MKIDINALLLQVNYEIEKTKDEIAYYETFPEYDFFRRLWKGHLRYLETFRQILLDEKLHRGNNRK